MKNSSNIVLRPLCKKDYHTVEKIIRKTWKYDSLSPNLKDAQHMARLYLRSCLKRADYSCVAVENGNVAGIILANSKNQVPRITFRRTLSELLAILLLFTTDTGRRLGRFFRRFDDADADLLRNCGCTFDGEICFFAVDEASRGTGIGKQLFLSATEYLRSQNVKSFYLFTDSSCTYQFYEKRKMKRLGEKILTFQPHTDYKLHMFIYGDSFC